MQRIVEIARIESLEVKDCFLYYGGWREVIKITDSKITYKSRDEYGGNNRNSVSAKSKQYVEVLRAVPRLLNSSGDAPVIDGKTIEL